MENRELGKLEGATTFYSMKYKATMVKKQMVHEFKNEI